MTIYRFAPPALLACAVVALTFSACAPVPPTSGVSPSPAAARAPIATVSTAVPTPAPTVTLPPVVTTVTERVEVPGPTVYVEVPGDTVYVDVPGPVQTVYVDVPTLPADWDAQLSDANRRGWEDARIERDAQWAQALATPCATEDSSDCYWNAATSGNGVGLSFVDIGGMAYYLAG